MFEFLTALFQSITGVSKAVEKGLPSEKVADDNHIIHRERLVENEFNKRLRNSKVFLDLHPLLQVDTYCDIRFNDLDSVDSENFRKALHEMFPHREKRGLKLKQ
ncbi:hypothetical protein UFOVP1605_33 [uncultured Caudovirales phage]|uniref:Uncharacterized protein n=1 Tax=uncultured Caudovirales phage TaxID=2100421 RepID=A0A6J5SUW0_9CAUD|nr:hypothetical protein UFOVP1605_33 [uncultured Caudovirales phage]